MRIKKKRGESLVGIVNASEAVRVLFQTDNHTFIPFVEKHGFDIKVLAYVIEGLTILSWITNVMH